MKIKILIVSILILLLGYSFGGGYYLTTIALQPAKGQKDLVESKRRISKDYPFVGKWLDSLNQVKALKDTFIYNKDNIKLHAQYVRSAKKTNKTAVIVHGYTDNSMLIMQIAYLYSKDLNFNILVPDLQFHGLSEGDEVQMGWKDRLDVLEWMNLANQIYGGNTQMVIHGISMGAATTMMVSGEQQEPFVKCFIEDCGYTSVWDQFKKELKEDYSLPSFPILNCASWITDLRFGWNFEEASAIKQVSKCNYPMFFIHGNEDHYVPTKMVNEVYRAKSKPKEIWIVDGAAHAVSYKNNKEEYTNKVREFVNKYIR